MFNINNIVFKLETDKSMQKLINNISNEYNIEYINTRNDILYIVFRDNYSREKRINRLKNKNYISNVNTDKTLFGKILEFSVGSNLYNRINPEIQNL